MKKPFSLLWGLFLLFSPAAQAANFGGFDDIDAIMEDNALTDVTNRYSSALLSFFPEQATRIGFESANESLDRRDGARDAQASRAYDIVEESLQAVNRKKLSEPKKTDYDTLTGLLAMSKWDLERNRTAMDPLLYTQAFDAVYDLTLKTMNVPALQDPDLAARWRTLPQVAAQAKNNLAAPAPTLAQLAMEDAYYAYLSLDQVTQYLMRRAEDDVSRAQLRTEAKASKEAVRQMFEQFKQLSSQNRQQDFRLGEEDYFFVLKNRYFIEEKPRSVQKLLSKNLDSARQALQQVLEAFALPALSQDETVLDGLQVPGEESAEGVTVTPLPSDTTENPDTHPAQESETPAPVQQDGRENAAQAPAAVFHTLTQRMIQPVKEQDFLAELEKEAAGLTDFFVREKVLPSGEISFSIYRLPQYYAYTRPYLFLPPFGTQTNPTNDLFLRLPEGNELTRQEMRNRDFNRPTQKLMVAGQLVPGLFYRSAYNYAGLSPLRKMYPVPTLRNGWEVYAQHLAAEYSYISSDEERLYLAWADYVRAAAAVTDFKLQTGQFTYTEAYDFLTGELGFEQEQAQNMLKQMIRRPGEAVSYIYGYKALADLRNKYQKKQGKNFSLSDFHAKVMSLGDIPPGRLEEEMQYAYDLEKNRLKQALNSSFYMN